MFNQKFQMISICKTTDFFSQIKFDVGLSLVRSGLGSIGKHLSVAAVEVGRLQRLSSCPCSLTRLPWKPGGWGRVIQLPLGHTPPVWAWLATYYRVCLEGSMPDLKMFYGWNHLCGTDWMSGGTVQFTCATYSVQSCFLAFLKWHWPFKNF